MYTVNVLLSSYNGEKYIKEQIDSVLVQEGVKVILTVRDDGSSDQTTKILDEYKNQGKLDWYTGENLKPAKSFLHLVKTSKEADYYAFCDQDDYWEKDKLFTAINAVNKEKFDGPVVYSCIKKLVDSNLNELKISDDSYYPKNIYHSIVSSNSAGCTQVFNKSMRDLLNLHDVNHRFMHDNYIVKLCFACGGKFIFDPAPHILYRQHGNNQIGGAQTKIDKIKRYLKSIKENSRYHSYSIEQIFKEYNSSLSEEGKEVYTLVANYRKGFNRFKLAFDKRYKTGNRKMNMLFKISVLLGVF